MPEPIKVRGRFLTANETAELLGVPKKRAQVLISMVEGATGTPKGLHGRSAKAKTRHAKTRSTKKNSAKASHK